jgi:hypothetical protein
MARTRKIVGCLGGLIWTLVSCGGSSSSEGTSDCPLGTETCHCREDGSCSDGLSCLSNLCVDAPVASGGSVGDGDPGVSGGDAGESPQIGAVGGKSLGGSGSGGRGAGGESSGGSSVIEGEVGGTGVGGSGVGGTGEGGTLGEGGATGAAGGTSSQGGIGIFASGGSSSGGMPPACAATEQVATLAPVNIVIMLDKSGSMGNGSSATSPQNYDIRWAPVKAGMIAFFEGANSVGVSASLSYFPANGDMATTCGNNYTTPNVSLTPLEDPTRLITSLNATEPSGGTPTLSAMYGATTYAKKLMNDNPGSKSAVLLVTDGEPAIYVTEDETTGDLNGDGQIVNYIDPNCVPAALQSTTLQNIIPDIAQVVSSAATNEPMVPTYVVGIGFGLDSLSAIATAGGTDMILSDNATDSDAITATIVGVLEAIRGEMFACAFAVAEMTDIDFDRVNVNFVHSDNTVEQLIRSDTCSTAGWYYDVAPGPDVTPTKIQLCPQTCEAVKADPDSELRLNLGCETRIAPPS